MERQIRADIRSCEKCQASKPSLQRIGGSARILAIPKQPWASVSMELITQVPQSKKVPDAIMVMVDRLTKLDRFIPTTTEHTAEQAAFQFFSMVFRHNGLPSDIVSDRYPRFVSNYWQALWKNCGAELAMFIAHHPQPNGQTKSMNR